MKRYRFIDSLLWLASKGGYGAQTGAVGAIVVGLGAHFGSIFLENGVFCQSDRACDEIVETIIFIAIISAVMGIIFGALFGIVGQKIASKLIGPEKEKVGAIIGGLIGGVAPWAILQIL